MHIWYAFTRYLPHTEAGAEFVSGDIIAISSLCQTTSTLSAFSREFGKWSSLIATRTELIRRTGPLMWELITLKSRLCSHVLIWPPLQITPVSTVSAWVSHSEVVQLKYFLHFVFFWCSFSGPKAMSVVISQAYAFNFLLNAAYKCIPG